MDWEKIETVLLDMDGTLLDLHFDQQFWQQHLPQRYAEKHTLTFSQACEILLPRFEKVAGTLQWYCLDYWSQQLDMDMVELKQEIDHLIAIHPHVIQFLVRVKELGKQVVLTTNAHGDSVSLKMARADLRPYFDAMISAHDLGCPKEEQAFWTALADVVDYLPATSLLVDDNLQALQSAQTFGIGYQIGVSYPNSKGPAVKYAGFDAISDFRQIMPESP